MKINYVLSLTDAIIHDTHQYVEWCSPPRPPLVRHDTLPAFRFKINYSEDWEEVLAKSTVEAIDTSMTEEEFDSTRITVTSIQVETPSFRQQDEQTREL